MVLRELVRLEPSIRPQGELLFLLMQTKPAFVPDIVSNETLYVIGLHGSGDKFSRYLQDLEVAKVAVSCHIALDMPKNETKWKGDEVGSVFERACRLSDKLL